MRILVLLLTLIPAVVFAQVDIDFESGGFGRWSFPDESIWGIDSTMPISGNYSMKHIYNNPEAGIDVASLPTSGLSYEDGKTQWLFKVRHAYNPSGSNNWCVILSSEQELSGDITGGTLNGFALGVNLNSYDDTLRLYRIDDGIIEIIANTSLNWQTDIGTHDAPLLSVEREPGGFWQVLIQMEGGEQYEIGSGHDITSIAADFFGIYYKYTSSCDQLFWIDDIEIGGVFIIDSIAPRLSHSGFLSERAINLTFNENIPGDLLSIENFFLLPDSVCPISIELIKPQSIELRFYQKFSNKTNYMLEIRSVCDNSGNCLDSTIKDLFFVYPEWGDLIITEIMSDPDPEVELRGIEYIEIYNCSAYPINMRSLSLLNGSYCSPFPEFMILPDTYIAVCDASDTLKFMGDFPLIGLKSMPSLNNSSDYILLTDTHYGCIHGVEYSSSWRRNNLKNDGGWSFEMIDPAYPFEGSGNWTFSTDPKGGTPGNLNSVYKEFPDLTYPGVANCFPISPSELRLVFTEPVANVDAANINLQIDNLQISSITKLDSLRRSYSLLLSEKMVEGEIYSLNFQNIVDYGANDLNPNFYRFGLSVKPVQSDVVINEVMFKPLSGDPEYIEFFNRSEKLIDAATLRLACINLQSGDTSNISVLSSEPRSIMPGDYYVITEDKSILTSQYFSSDPLKIFEVNNLPSLPDSKGRILLLNKSLTVIDDFTYHDDYHLDMISGTAGISLERIDPWIATNLKQNWHSATGLSGWGTPGIINSVAILPDIPQESSLTLSSTKITPDNDGYEDQLYINLNLSEGVWILDVIIYDDMGYRVKNLFENITISGQESLIWDGTDEQNQLLSTGIYIVFIRAVSISGETKKWKKVCTVLRR